MANRFDLLRLCAALAVFAAHSDFLYRLHLPVPIPGHSLGSLAVYVFFFISGYLVCQSWMREPIWQFFWVKRLLRIFPGLIAAVVFSVVVIGWTVTTLSSAHYWSDRGTWANLANNALGLATVQTLPGVFEANPFARAVNGSLWTIRYELAMYSVLATLAWAARGRRHVFPVTVGVLAALWLVARVEGWDGVLVANGGWISDVFRWQDFCGFGVLFFVGCTFAVYAVRPRGWMVALATLAGVLALRLDNDLMRQACVWVMITCATFYFAHVGLAAKKGSSRTRMDISYGVYIYAFPIQQAATALCLSQGWSLSICVLISLLPILVLALASWYGVERPCIRAGRRWLGVRRRSITPAASSSPASANAGECAAPHRAAPAASAATPPP